MKQINYLSKSLFYLAILFFAGSQVFSQVTLSHPYSYEIDSYLSYKGPYSFLNQLVADISTDSQDYNKRGYEAYSDGDYYLAYRLFNQAIEADNDNCFAYYNQACTIVLMSNSNLNISDKEEIAHNLLNAINIHPGWALMAMVDPDFDSIRKTGFRGAYFSIGGSMIYGAETHFERDGIIYEYIALDRETDSHINGFGMDSNPSDFVYRRLTESRGYYVVLMDYIVVTYLIDRVDRSVMELVTDDAVIVKVDEIGNRDFSYLSNPELFIPTTHNFRSFSLPILDFSRDDRYPLRNLHWGWDSAYY